MDTNTERTKVVCSVRFKVNITRIMQLDNIEFYLSAEDKNIPVVDNKVIRRHILNLLKDNKIEPNDGTVYREEEEDSIVLDNIDEIVSFDVCKPPPPFVNPNQIGLPL